MDPSSPQLPPEEPELRSPENKAKAREYEAIHNKLFVIRLFVTAALIMAYLFTGASAGLAEGLRTWFGSLWGVVNALYVAITIFGFSAFLFPFSLYGDYELEHRFELSRQSFGSWLWDYVKSLLFDLVIGVLFFSVIYALLRWSPDYWWLLAATFYIFFSMVLTTIAPVMIMPLFHKFEPLEKSELTEAVKAFVEREGLKVLGVYSWGLEAKTTTGNAALTGMGRTRRIVLGDTMIKGYSKEEIIGVLAHEVGHHKHRDLWRLLGVGTVIATVGFYIAHIALQSLVGTFGFEGIADIGSFPIFVFCLFLFALITMPLVNAYSRKREYAADAYAVRAIGAAEPLTSALEKLAEQNLADTEPSSWIEFLLHSHPSISRRVKHARQVEQELDESQS
jgi:STE24 endopeptidase